MRCPVFFINDDLIAASTECQVKSGFGLFSQNIKFRIAFIQQLFLNSRNPHTERNGNTIYRMNPTNLIKKREIILCQYIQSRPTKAGKVFTVSIRMYITPQLRQLTDNTIVDVSPQRCLLYCRHSLCHFFHIVDFNACKYGNGLHEESLLMFRFRHIIKIQNQIPVSIADFIRQTLIYNPILAVIDSFIKISGLPPNPIHIQIFHSLVNTFIFLNGSSDPIEKDAVCPAQSGIFVDNRNAYG